MLKDDAVREVVKKAGTQFDPDVVSALVKIHKNPEFDAIIEKSRFLSEAQKTSAPT